MASPSSCTRSRAPTKGSDALDERVAWDETWAMHPSPSQLSPESRSKLVEALNAVLCDGLDLHGAIKVAHWNIKGPHFATLHPLFETFAIALAGFTDEIAERAVTLGGLAVGTSRTIAARSRIAGYPEGTTRDLEHAKLLADRIDSFLVGLREARGVGEKLGDTDTVDLLTQIVSEFEKHGWFLRATLG